MCEGRVCVRGRVCEREGGERRWMCEGEVVCVCACVCVCEREREGVDESACLYMFTIIMHFLYYVFFDFLVLRVFLLFALTYFIYHLSPLIILLFPYSYFYRRIVGTSYSPNSPTLIS